MSNARICIPICAKTADEVTALTERAAPLADVIELRFDCLSPEALDEGLPDLAGGPYLVTFRPESQGGSAADDLLTRAMFWASVPSKVGVEFDRLWFDNERDLGGAMQWSEDCFVIHSHHDFDGVPADLEAIYQELSDRASAVKIAVTAKDVTDAIPLWKLLERAKHDAKAIIPIAMGEAGKWTRILGPAHGAFMTFASLDADAATAAGQISAADMIDVFRVKEISPETKVYGIIAGDTSYSVSPYLHNAAFKASAMDRIFIPLQVADLDAFLTRMVRPETREINLNFHGFAVTNPHKQAVIPHLDEIDDTARTIGAVNTVKIENGKLFGCNTDAAGFIGPLKRAFGDLKGSRVAVIGAGGASRACIYALRQEGAEVTLFARDPQKVGPLAKEFGVELKRFEISNLKSEISDSAVENSRPRSEFSDFDVLVNTTPLGTKGENEDKSIATSEDLSGLKLVYDLVYNPAETRLLREAKLAGVPAIGGLEMLVAQGAHQFEIWTGGTAPENVMIEAVTRKLNA